MYVFSMYKNEIFGPSWCHVDSSLYSVKISLRILDRPGAAIGFQSSTEKAVCSRLILICTDTYSNNIKYQFKIIE